MSQRVIIVGAGPGGLATALQLAHQGHEVTILERRDRVGGRTSGLEIEGFRWDTGPTFFLYPQVLADLLAIAGRSMEEEIPMVQLDPQYRISFGAGGHLDATPEVERMEAAIAALAPQDAPGLRRFLDDNRRKLSSFKPILERPFLRLRDFLAPELLRALPMLRPFSSVDRDLRRYFSDERIRLAFSFQSKYLGMSPMRCPSLFSILSFIEYEFGVFHPLGGCHAITEALARMATEMGAQIRCDEPVERLRFTGRRVTGVETPRGSYEADAVVLNADFARAMTRLVPQARRRRWTDRRIRKSRFSCSTFMLYLGIEGVEQALPHHTIHIAREYEKNLRQIENEFVLPQDPSFYVQNPGVTDPSLAPPGHSALYVLVPVPHQHPNIDWESAWPGYRQLVLDRVEQLGVPDLRQRIVVEHMITPANWDRDYEIHLGATFNLAHDLGQMLHLRPRNRFEDLDGVYLVGGGTHPGSGLPVIFESARIAAQLISEDFAPPLGARSLEAVGEPA